MIYPLKGWTSKSSCQLRIDYRKIFVLFPRLYYTDLGDFTTVCSVSVHSLKDPFSPFIDTPKLKLGLFVVLTAYKCFWVLCSSFYLLVYLANW